MNMPSIQPLNEWLSPRKALNGLSLMDHLFNRLDGAYPGRWRSSFPGAQSVENWRNAWVEAFLEDGITPPEVKVGIAACRKLYDWPPSINEFIKACRPDRTEALFIQAQRLVFTPVADRNYAGDAVLYWSIQRFGEHDLKAATNAGGGRWRQVVAEVIDHGRRGLLPVIPVRREQLPEPGQTSISSAEVDRRIQSVVGSKLNPNGDKAWAERLKVRHEAGEKLSLVQVDAYLAALELEAA